MIARVMALPRTVWLLGAISLLNDAASDMIYPLVPLYLTTVLMAGPKALGVIEGIAEAVSSVLKLFAGLLADRSRHIKFWVVGGYSVAGFARPLIALSTSWQGVLACRFADRIGKGLRSAPRDAMLSLSVEPTQRGLAFGFHRAMDNAGAVLGPLTAAGLLTLGFSLRQVFALAVIPALAVLILSVAMQEPARSPEVITKMTGWTWRGMPVSLQRYLVVLGIFTLGNSSNMFLLLRAQQLGLSAIEVPLLWALVSAVAALLSTPLSAWSDCIDRRQLIVVGWIVYAVFYVIFGLLPAQAGLLWPMFGLYGVFLAATEGAEKALVADLASTGSVGAAFGWYHLVVGLLLLPASMLFGALWSAVSPLTAFGFGSSCALVAALLLHFWVGAESRGRAP